MPKSNPELAAAMGKRLSEARVARGMTQEAVAEQAGIAYQQYNKAENGKVCLGADSIVRVCRTLQISADYLLTGTQNSNSFPEIAAILEGMSDRQREAVIKFLLCITEDATKK